MEPTTAVVTDDPILRHLDVALGALAEPAPRIVKAMQHVTRARELYVQSHAAAGATNWPLVLALGAGLYFLTKGR